MTPNKLLVSQILIVFAVVLGGIWFATQWPAADLNGRKWVNPRSGAAGETSGAARSR